MGGGGTRKGGNRGREGNLTWEGYDQYVAGRGGSWEGKCRVYQGEKCGSWEGSVEEEENEVRRESGEGDLLRMKSEEQNSRHCTLMVRRDKSSHEMSGRPVEARRK